MTAIFADFVEEIMEVFMDDFSVYGTSFDNCLDNLNKVLQRCEDTNLVLSWEKCHFMVKEGILLGHKISGKGIEVDRAKVEAIEKLPPPMNLKGIRSFLGQLGFYRRFIRNFAQVSIPLTKLLQKSVRFKFSNECMVSFNCLKQALVDAPILKPSNYSEPFELVCNASHNTVDVILGQYDEGVFNIIHFANKTLNDA